MSVIWPPLQPDAFGPITTLRDVRTALQSTIETWSATYINELAYQTGIVVEPFEYWERIYTDRELPAGVTATCWSTCWTTDPRKPPVKQGNGVYMGHFLAQANIVVYDLDWQTAADRMAVYLAAVRTAVLQHGSLGDVAGSTGWIGEAVKEDTRQTNRTVETGVIQFSVTVQNLVTTRGRPTLNQLPGTPDPTPTITTPTVADITLTKTGVD